MSLEAGKVLLSALVAMMVIRFALQRLGHNLDGDNPDPSLMERMVLFLQSHNLFN